MCCSDCCLVEEESRPVLDLRCQLRLQRQVSPVRTRACLHLQTVDLASLLAMLPAARLDQLARQRDILEEPLKVCTLQKG